MKTVLKNALGGCLLVFGFVFLSLVSFIALILVLGSFGGHTTHTAPERPPTPSPAPVTNYEPPKREHDPALDKRLMDAMEAAKNGTYGGGKSKRTPDGSTPRDEFIEPSIREFGDANGNSWLDPHTFQDNTPPPGKFDPSRKK